MSSPDDAVLVGASPSAPGEGREGREGRLWRLWRVFDRLAVVFAPQGFATSDAQYPVRAMALKALPKLRRLCTMPYAHPRASYAHIEPHASPDS